MIELLKINIKECRKNKNEDALKVFTTLLGDIQLESSRKNRDLTHKECEDIVKKFIKNNHETMKYLDTTGNKYMSLAYELSLLQDLLPQTLSLKEINEVLTKHCLDAIIGAKSKGQAMGIAMKTLKSLNFNVDGKDVDEIISEMVN
jgi:uncharacterized protein YqeY